jgi:hypothetical protein
MEKREIIIVIMQILFFSGFYYYVNSDYPCKSFIKSYRDHEFNIRIDTVYLNQRYLVIAGKNENNISETFNDGASYLVHIRDIFFKGDTLIKKRGELFFELIKSGTGEKKIIKIECK